MSRERRCGHHAAETPQHACTAVRVRKYHSESKERFHSHIITPSIFELAAVHKKSSLDVAANCLAAPRRNFEADSAAPWQRAPPLDHVQVAAVCAAWHES